ncbi:MAG: DUF452 family protein [Muribaculaceae bacterium]|nr:DUF452 family protein [Muribaculaceae bacterium]
MKIEFLTRQPENTRLILIVCGWSTGPEVIPDISIKGWDMAIIHDFSDLEIDSSFLNSYYTVYLYAWSLGVFAASRLIPADKITCAFAINGTLSPADDNKGIPIAIYNGTLSTLDERNLKKFRLRMYGDKQMLEVFDKTGPADIEGLKKQLSAILDLQFTKEDSAIKELPWVRAYISRDDRIFPPANQKNAWEMEPDTEIVELEGHHYPDFNAIIRMTIADTETVAHRFHKAADTYDTHAIAQYSSAIKLAGLLGERRFPSFPKILEIGCGTGLFTREYSRIVHPSKATFVDITSTGPFKIADDEEYFIEDAEKWIERNHQQWDMILSASAIQWFADIPRFLHLCSERLRADGILAISTFLPGNMSELDAYRPAPLIYPRAEELRKWLERDYDEIQVIEDEIRVEFKSVREMLMHLKHTGVGGSAQGPGISVKDMAHLNSLTYRPVYALGRKKKK